MSTSTGAVWQDLQRRGLVAVSTPEDALQAELAAGPVGLYCGFDPTAPSLHVGHLTQVLTLRRFQEHGHRPFALVGGATGLIGDPRPTSERTLNSAEQVRAWVERIRDQLTPFLDFEGPAAATMVDNLDWLGGMSALELLRDVGKHFRVSKMLAKESVSARLNSEHGISYTEFSYQLLQAADFLELYRRHGVRLQTGGSDQWGNLTAGVDLLHRVERQQVHAMGTPLVTKADGTKFGKSEGGAVWLDPAMTSPYAFHQFWLNSDDRDVMAYVRYFTTLDRDEEEQLALDLQERAHLRAPQRRLASELTALVHGPQVRDAVEAAAGALFGGGDLRDVDERTLLDATAELPSAELPVGASVVDALTATGLSPSRSAARRSIAEGAVSVGGSKVAGEDAVLAAEDFVHGRVAVLRRGRRTLAAVRLAAL
ncbi:tyrosine--tRNA ligase [Aquipuribacter hungaricus]|uniref:Tyrosine--tRNA ligase n=1 Tax=Aquipuribacter hungaricus TaxID=545624 RepID=A0ABV7WP02_9MICO